MAVYGVVGLNSQLLEEGEAPSGWIQMRRERPTQAHVARGDGEWELSIDRQLAEISAWRTRQESIEVTFEYAGRAWDAGLKSRSRIEPLLKLDALPDGFFWTDHRNNDVPVTMDDLRAIGAAMNRAIVDRGFMIHQRQREMKRQLELMTAEELLEFVPGWPE